MEDNCFNFISETFYFRPTMIYYRTLLICYIEINAFTQNPIIQQKLVQQYFFITYQ